MNIFDNQNSKKHLTNAFFTRNSPFKEGTNNMVKREKTRLGKMEMQLLAYAQLRNKEIISSGEIAIALDISAEQE
jgi:hypothetical protein